MERHLVGLAVVLAALACGDGGPVGPDPEPDPEPTLYETARFTIADFVGLPAAVIDSLGTRVEAEFDRVAGLLTGFAPPPLPVELRVQSGRGIPFVNIGQNRMTHWEDLPRPQYFTHQLAHLFTRYQQSNFIEEGVAVWVTEQLLRDGEAPDPFRGQPPHAWVTLFDQHGSAISLFTALRASNLGHNFEGSSADASAWQLFVQAGSFTRWMIDEYGYDRWLIFYQTGIIANAIGLDTPAAEEAWVTQARTLYPDPLPCEEALVVVEDREPFWCARARGQ